MTKKVINQKSKFYEDLINTIEPNFIFNDKPINRFNIIENSNDHNQADKAGLLKRLKNQINSIENCSLKDNSQNIIIGDGNINSPIMLIGEAPGIEEDKDGFQSFVAYGNLVSYRQKSEGKNEYVEGWGERMEFDSRADKVEFFKQARLRRGADEVHGEYISYESKTEFFQVNNGTNAKNRVRAVIQQKKKKQE